MNDANRKLIRTFYQSLATKEEEEIFYKIMAMDKEERMKYLAVTVLGQYPIDMGTYEAIQKAAAMTKEELAALLAGEVRKVADGIITRFLTWLKGLF